VSRKYWLHFLTGANILIITWKKTAEGSAINLDTAVVLQIIAAFREKRELIENKMTGEETLSHPIWIEWKQVRTDLQAALVCANN
jgi:hypothetical protein